MASSNAPSRTCSVDGCDHPVNSRGWCVAHYCRWKRTGDINEGVPVAPIPTWESVEDRFWAKADKNANGCWLWLGAVSNQGYGGFRLNGRGGTLAHRVAYELTVGPIPAGMELDHLCHTTDATCAGGVTCIHRRCVNPSHLEPVTGTENLLRGLAPSAINRRKTHCRKGHPFSPENTRVNKSGHRLCLTCSAEWHAKNPRQRKAS